MDCRKRQNKGKSNCKVKKFCDKKSNHLLDTGKGFMALTDPTFATVVTVYET